MTMQSDEHDDDLSTTVEQRGDAQTDGFPGAEEEFEDRDDDAEFDDEDVVGK
jgi:hypothetical protein